MMRALLVAALLVGTSTVAAAGPFLGLGLGPGASVGGTDKIEAGGRSFRLLGGLGLKAFSVGRLSAEASLTTQSLAFRDNVYGSFRAYELGADLRYNFPLSGGFEIFGKVGIQHSSISHESDSAYDASGNGLLLGAGAEYLIKTPVASGSIFVDYTLYASQLDGEDIAGHGSYTGYGNSLSGWMLGVTVGF